MRERRRKVAPFFLRRVFVERESEKERKVNPKREVQLWLRGTFPFYLLFRPHRPLSPSHRLAGGRERERLKREALCSPFSSRLPCRSDRRKEWGRERKERPRAHPPETRSGLPSSLSNSYFLSFPTFHLSALSNYNQLNSIILTSLSSSPDPARAQ